jgi:eukaryotic-like serine/threonine-protein kinase
MSSPVPDDVVQPPSADLVEVLTAQFLGQLRRGERPDRQALVRAHPHLSPQLDRRLAHAEMVYRLGLAPDDDSTSIDETENAPSLPLNAGTDWAARVTAAAVALAAPRQPDSPPDYEILSVLGHGGMGIVYKARQKSLNRGVALKVLSAGAHASLEMRARFHIEAEALASLQHPNIVQVYEVGEYDGCPFMAMEFLDGGTLRQYLAGKPQPARAAAALVETLARAMHVAHQRGIVHRDLKPANILLKKEEGGRMKDESDKLGTSSSSFILHPSSLLPKITDFGLAKRLAEDHGQTTTGAVLGTPGYMAPEQAAGRVHDIGPPTDVHALGVILYEMLTGRLPFHGATVLDMLRRVEWEEPAAPSTLCRKLPRDLETICLKCLAKEPAQRYATALDLADDLRRFCDGAPIAARPASVGERVWKWAKRRPAWAALIGVVVTAVCALTLLGVSWSVQVRAERDRARHNLEVARRAIDELYTKMASERLFDEPQLDPLCQELLAKARTLYEELAQQQSDDAAVRRASALAWFRLGEIDRLRDHHDAAEHDYGEAIARQEELARDNSTEPSYRQDLANSHNGLGELLREHGRPAAEAERHYRAARELQQELLRQFPAEPSYHRELARSDYNLGIVHKDTNHPSEARADYDRAVELLAELYQADARDPNVRQDLAHAHINRGVLRRQGGQPEDAGRDYDRAIDLLARLRDEFPSRAAYKFDLAIARQDRGNLLWSQGRHADAQREQQQALALLRGLVADFSSRPRYQKKLGNALINLGSALVSAGDPAGAGQCWQQARTLLAALVKDYPTMADYHALLGMTLALLGWQETEQKHWPEARRLIEESIAETQAALERNPEQPDYRKELRNEYQDLAETLVQLGDHAAAVQAARNLAAVFPERAQDSYYAACFVARCARLAQKDPDTAHRYVAQALALLRQAVASATPGLKRLPDEKHVFEPLASHAEFAGLLRELEARTSLAKQAP